MLDLRTPVASVVLDHSECAAVFQRHRIDYCCKGEASIADAAAERGVDPDDLVRELDLAISARQTFGSVDPRARSTPALIAYIMRTHHDFLRRTLPFLQGLSAKIASVHADREPALRRLADLVTALTRALLPHLEEEERVLFPALLAATPGPGLPHLIERQLGHMRDEHVAISALLDQMRTATADFVAPTWACGSYRTLFSELAALESDILHHHHVENHVLLPRFTPA